MKALAEILLSKSESRLEEVFKEQLKYFDITLDQQEWVGPFRLDFSIKDKKLDIELDGAAYHNNPQASVKDDKRTRYLESVGWRVYRVPAWMVFKRKELAASELALRYFESQLNSQQKRHAIGILAQYFQSTDSRLSYELIERGLRV